MRSLVAILSATLLAAWPALAGAGQLVALQVISRSTGQALETYSHRGQTYVPGNPGERYSVRLSNRSGTRILVVLSVDGVNAVTGETASPAQAGYVLEPYASTEIAGWRKSLREVAQFYFTSLPDSYAARSGRPDHVGVIGAAIFRERPRPLPYPSIAPLSKGEPAAQPGWAGSLDSAPEAEASAPSDARRSIESSRLGTGHGEREYSLTEYAAFQRAGGTPSEVVTVRYDSRANLLARGIIPRVPGYPDPQPFPGSFVPDPNG